MALRIYLVSLQSTFECPTASRASATTNKKDRVLMCFGLLSRRLRSLYRRHPNVLRQPASFQLGIFMSHHPLPAGGCVSHSNGGDLVMAPSKYKLCSGDPTALTRHACSRGLSMPKSRCR